MDETAHSQTEEEYPHSDQPKAKSRDRWDKVDIISRSVGAFATAAVVAVVGIFGSSFLAERQEKETNLRLYAELMSRREDADTVLRKEMFSPIITDILKEPADIAPERTLLNLELLTYNFHDSINLGPLLKAAHDKLEEHREQNRPFIGRLEQLTRDVIQMQTGMLAEAGGKRDVTVDFEALKDQPGGLTVLDDFITLKTDRDQPPLRKQVRVEVLGVNHEKDELRVRLIVKSSPDVDEVDAVFTVGPFDFPLVDFIRMPDGYRCAIALNAIDQEYADFTFVYYPGSRGSTKETEVLYNLRTP
jgi:hypothetical protein